MVSAQGEQHDVKLYHNTRSDRGTSWYWAADRDNAADYIYCRHEGNYHSNGFGGATMRFPLEGGSVEVQGPWHSNAEALFAETGVDLRDKHHTRGVLGLCYAQTFYSAIDVIYFDEDWVLGSYNRVDDLARELANKYNVPIYGWMAGQGGGHSIYKEPQK